MSSVKLVVLDADQTVWDHPDVSSLRLPLTRIRDNALQDTTGATLTLFDGVRELLTTLRTMGLLTALVTWNEPQPVHEALRRLEVASLFTFVEAEFHPRKHELIRRILTTLSQAGTTIEPPDILYVDDRTRHLSDITRHIGPVQFLHMWHDVKNHTDLLQHIRRRMSTSGDYETEEN